MYQRTIVNRLVAEWMMIGEGCPKQADIGQDVEMV
jgi:hypothetical protein